MKKLTISIILSFVALLSFGQVQERMVIEKKDGTKFKLNVDDISRVVFEEFDIDSKSDLIGVWESRFERGRRVLTFTEEELTVEDYFIDQEGKEVKDDKVQKIAYSLNNGILSYTITEKYYDQQQQKEVEWSESFELVTKFLYEKSVLALLSATHYDQYNEYFLSEILYKKGATIPAKLEDIQGDWRWYMHGDKSYTRVAVQIKDNNMTLIIVPWGQRYDGTITYQNGYISLTVTAAYTSREEGTGEGWGEGDLNPETLEATWTPLDRGSWMYYELGNMPFIANGNEAYGILANLPGVYIKFNINYGGNTPVTPENPDGNDGGNTGGSYAGENGSGD